MTPDNTPLDLDQLEAKLCCLIPRAGAEVPSCHEFSICDCTVEKLISELRQARELQTKLIQMLKDREAERVIKLSPQEWQRLEERLKSAEEVLRFASEMVFYPIGQEEILELRCNEYNRILTPLRIIVRAHFAKYSSDEGEKE